MSLHLSWAWFQNRVARQTGMLGGLTTIWENTTVHHWAKMSGRGGCPNKRGRKNVIGQPCFLLLLKQANSSLLVEGAANSARLLSATCITARLQAAICHGLKLASFQSQSGVEERLSCYSFALPLSAEMLSSSDKIPSIQNKASFS